ERFFLGTGPALIGIGGFGGFGRSPQIHKLPPEPTLDAQVAVGHVVVDRGGDLDDLFVLDVDGERAADAAVGADGVGGGLAGFVPGAGFAQVVLALEHQGAGGADADAVAAVHAGGVGQPDVVFGGDAGVEAATGDGDGEGVLSVGAAGLDALVADDALRVVADVEVVVDFHRLAHGRCAASNGLVGPVVMPGPRGVALVGLGARRGGAEALRLRVVPLHVALDLRRGGGIHRGAQQLEDEPAAQADALGVGLH